jgi:predicted dehydrogenase
MAAENDTKKNAPRRVDRLRRHLKRAPAAPVRLRGCELAAFCDVVVERAQKHADKYGGAVYDDARTMLQSVHSTPPTF